MKSKLSCWLMTSAILLASVAPTFSQTTAAPRTPETATTSAAKPSDADIAAAKSSGKVWVNLDTGVYHKDGRWYGKTKNGKFMSETDAKQAGFKAAKRD